MIFQCSVESCERMFNNKKELREHERTHPNNRPFKCKECDQTFTQYSSLQKHARVHDKQKPYRCEYPDCSQAFSQISNLIRHQRIHTGEKPFTCDYCHKKFASGSNLKQHLQIHSERRGRSTFACSFEGCDKSYLYQSSLKKHMLVAHPEFYKRVLHDSNLDGKEAEARDAQRSEPRNAVNNANGPQEAGATSRDGTVEAQKGAGGGNLRQDSILSRLTNFMNGAAKPIADSSVGDFALNAPQPADNPGETVSMSALNAVASGESRLQTLLLNQGILGKRPAPMTDVADKSLAKGDIKLSAHEDVKQYGLNCTAQEADFLQSKRRRLTSITDLVPAQFQGNPIRSHANHAASAGAIGALSELRGNLQAKAAGLQEQTNLRSISGEPSPVGGLTNKCNNQVLQSRGQPLTAANLEDHQLLKLLTQGGQAVNADRPGLPELPVGTDANLQRSAESYNVFPTQRDIDAVMGNLLETGNHQALVQLLVQHKNAQTPLGAAQNQRELPSLVDKVSAQRNQFFGSHGGNQLQATQESRDNKLPTAQPQLQQAVKGVGQTPAQGNGYHLTEAQLLGGFQAQAQNRQRLGEPAKETITDQNTDSLLLNFLSGQQRLSGGEKLANAPQRLESTQQQISTEPSPSFLPSFKHIQGATGAAPINGQTAPHVWQDFKAHENISGMQVTQPSASSATAGMTSGGNGGFQQSLLNAARGIMQNQSIEQATENSSGVFSSRIQNNRMSTSSPHNLNRLKHYLMNNESQRSLATQVTSGPVQKSRQNSQRNLFIESVTQAQQNNDLAASQQASAISAVTNRNGLPSAGLKQLTDMLQARRMPSIGQDYQRDQTNTQQPGVNTQEMEDLSLPVPVMQIQASQHINQPNGQLAATSSVAHKLSLAKLQQLIRKSPENNVSSIDAIQQILSRVKNNPNANQYGNIPKSNFTK